MSLYTYIDAFYALRYLFFYDFVWRKLRQHYVIIKVKGNLLIANRRTDNSRTLLRTGIYWFTILELITLIEWAARARW